MAVELRVTGAQGQVVAAISALQPSNHPGMAAQLARVQAAAIAEIAAFATRGKFEVTVNCHRDNTTSVILIRVSPSALNSAGSVITPMATLNDNEL